VCSLHFKNEDFKENSKTRVLRTGAVPTIFPGYPKYKQISKSERAPPKARNEVPTKRRKLQEDESITDCFNESQRSSVSESSPPLPSTEFTFVCCRERDTGPKWHREYVNMKARYKRLLHKVEELQEDLASVKLSTPVISQQVKIIEKDAEFQNTTAQSLMELIRAYGKERHRWSEFFVRKCIVWRAKSPKGYDTVRRSKMLPLPSYSTLSRYIGPSTLDEGFTPLIKKRLEEEIGQLTPEERHGSILFDEMSIKQQGKYVKQVGRVIGTASAFSKKYSSCPLANRLLCFVLTGLSTHYKIPVSYHLTKDLDHVQQLQMLTNVMAEVEKIGFKVLRVVSDCISFNVKTMAELCGGTITHRIPHPLDNTRPLFVSFDPCHIIKNLRNQFLDKKRKLMNCGRDITAEPVRRLYDKQKNDVIKPVRSLSRKMVFPSSFEKMNVSRAVRLFSVDITSALILGSEGKEAGFQNIDSTIQFMEYCRKWFEVIP